MPKQKGLVPPLRFPEFRNAGPWEVKRLGEVANVYQPETISQAKLSEEGEYLVYGANGVIGRYDRYNHENSQIAITCRGSTCGKVTFTKPKSWITGNAMVINVDSSKEVVKEFLYYQFVKTDLSYLITGTGQPQITSDINKHLIALPIPDEQQKIADCLSSLDELIQAEEKALEALKKHKKGLMQQLFPAPGETTPKLRFPEFRDAGPWEVKRLGAVCDFFKGKGLPKSEITPEGKMPCIHYGELFTDYGEVIRNIKSFTNSSGNYVLSKEDDVLMPTSDVTPNGLAKASCIKLSNVILGGDILIIRPYKEMVFGEYLSRFIRFRENEVLRYVSGTTVFHLYPDSISKFQVPLPSITEQQKIADCLSSLDDLILAKSKRVNALKRHKKGLLQNLFPQEIK